jgi:AraC family transcriptional activator of pobA
MAKDNNIPVYSICSLQQTEDRSWQELIAAPFADYLNQHPNLFIPHRHSFYHLVLFTKGSGYHTIDFEQFPVVPGQIYFMSPGQVHSWQFEGNTDGYVINFSEEFFKSFLQDGQYLEQFSFFQGIASKCVCNLDQPTGKAALKLLEQTVSEVQTRRFLASDLIRLLLLQVFIAVARFEAGLQPQDELTQRIQDGTLRSFLKLLEQHFTRLKLPKDYAALLYITPNHLNALCKDKLDKSAGAVIRDRIVLEAKRLLINGNLSISQIAWQLNFTDNSYFSRFFKKATGVSPEAFRKSILDQHENHK